MRRLLTGRGLDPLAERVLFALVCNQLFGSPLSCEDATVMSSRGITKWCRL